MLVNRSRESGSTLVAVLVTMLVLSLILVAIGGLDPGPDTAVGNHAHRPGRMAKWSSTTTALRPGR